MHLLVAHVSYLVTDCQVLRWERGLTGDRKSSQYQRVSFLSFIPSPL